ncbi:unnamed protein product [Paramecium octaurelia]|uniref:Uncharacterized protein n=1 Tax=Paramecium octaurelia TaxID=43137 RepID=A0A8S1U3V9_PAROT|nr:unnamed protein product [Paramecium octaurelia]
MYEYWNGQDLQNRHPNTFDQQGNQFIQQIITKITHILDHFNQQKFINTLTILSEIKVQSLQFNARKLAQSSDELQDYISQFMEVDGNALRLNEQFQKVEKQKSAELLLKMIEMAQGTMRDWYQFQHQQLEIEKFEERVDLLRHNFELKQSQNNCCASCQLI